MWLHSSVGRASHRYRGGHRFDSRWSPDFSRLLLSNFLNWKIYCYFLSFRFSRGNRLFAGLWFGKGKPHFPTFLKPFAWSIQKLYVEGTLHIENEFNNNLFMLDWKAHTSIYLLKHINLSNDPDKSYSMFFCSVAMTLSPHWNGRVFRPRIYQPMESRFMK